MSVKLDEQKAGTTAGRRKKWVVPVGIVVVVALLVAGVVAVWQYRSGAKDKESSVDYTVKRQGLTVSVTENGNIKARHSEDIKSKVEGRATIISIVPEGIQITPEDVDSGKVLVELDASELRRRLTEREINFASAQANLTEAQTSFEIQQKQNESDLNASRMKVKFGLMDLQKYLGDKLAQRLIDKVDAADTDADIVAMVHDPNLGGSALQRVRDLDAAISLAGEDLERAKTRLFWTRKLFEKEYASQSDVEGDEFDLDSKDIKLKQAGMSKELFERYEFSKEAQKLLSDYREAKRELERTEARTRSKIAQSQANLTSNQARHKLQEDELEKTQEQLAACTIRATKPGMVVYASSSDFWQSRNRPIEEGSDIHERQKIITIPDMSELAVEIQVHEAWVDKIEPNLPATITVDAFPDKEFSGRVLKVAPLATAQAFWMDTGLKVYKTEVGLNGEHAFLKPGMSAKVEVIIKQLDNVLSVPVQAVANRAGAKYCYVVSGKRADLREVKVGEFNDEFIEIVEGLTEGEEVSLVPPKEVDAPTKKKESEAEDMESAN